MINIIVNGEARSIASDMSIESLLDLLQIKDKTMAAAVNMKVVKEEKWASFIIKDGQKLEFLNFVGGG